ncbi:hypothetical protein [Mycobacterium sp. 852013-50091_SCH5140682]|uniref:hypothetical protein n=1 Tax=Mycobacterium sp. 852013-50091_SCH5140682 TaxID=1834109 RepID=UPI0009EE6D69|nr:hypothetical protein [Mycobacterium sp. 852013-50091_SCH5140682]
MIAAVLSTPKSSRKMTQLSEMDRAWLVAGLTLAGVTAQDIADRMRCSLRLVRAIRAEDLTQFAVVAQTQNRTLGDDLRTERCEHAVTRRNLAEAQADLERLRAQFDQIVDAHMTGQLQVFKRCGHPMVPYNTYEHGGRKWCRTCGRERKAERRKALAAV